MAKTDYIYPPDGLHDLGLSQDQLRAVRGYFALRARFARQQRRTALGLALVIGASLIARSTFTDAALPFETLLQVVLKWVPVAAAVIGGASLALSQYIGHVADKRLPELGLSADAIRRVRQLAAAMVKVIIFGFKNR